MKDIDIFIKWTSPSLKDSMDFHWCGIGSLIVDGTMVPKFKMFCRKSDCKCFVEDLKAGDVIEFDGRRGEGFRICFLKDSANSYSSRFKAPDNM